VLKHPGAPRGVRVRFNGKRRVAVTSGAFDDETQRTKVVLRLPAASRYVDIALRLRAGTARVVVTDDQGASQDTGELGNAALGPGDVYRLKLRAIKVQGVPVPGVFDDIQVSRRPDPGPALATHFVYDQGGRLIGEYTTDGTPIAEYVYLQAQPLAMLRGGAVYYYHTDQLGTPKALTDQDQRRVWRADYTPFGDTTIAVNEVENPLRFPGQYFDQETGLHYNYFRDYDPSIGRYIESDPIGLRGGLNTYAYALNNPLRFIDPFGLEVHPIPSEPPSARLTCGKPSRCINPVTINFTSLSAPTVTKTFSLDCLVTFGFTNDIITRAPIATAKGNLRTIQGILTGGTTSTSARVVAGVVGVAASVPMAALLFAQTASSTFERCECDNSPTK